MIVGVIVLSYVAAGICLIDQMRRPASAWVAADRSRSGWIGLTIGLGLVALGLVALVAYLIGVVPRMSAAGEVDEAFRKRF